MKTCASRRALTMTVLVLLLSACSVLGPDYRDPSPQWLADWQPDLYGQLQATEEVSLARWWERFGDASLNALINDVLHNNPTLEIAGLRVLEARARLGGAKALRLPQVQQIDASATYLRQRQSDGFLPATDDSLGSYSASASLGWELDFWGRFQRAIEGADAAYLGSMVAQWDLQRILVAQTADLYFSYRAVQERLTIAKSNAKIQKRSFEITEQLFASGQQSELDLQQARTQYLATLATIPDLERQQVQVRNALALLLGRPPGALMELQGNATSLPEVSIASLSVFPAKLLLQRPDVRAAAWQAAAQSAQIGIAQAELYPSISLVGGFGWTGDSLGFTRDGTTFAAGPAIRWNIFDYGRIRANIRVQDARLQQALTAFDGSVLAAARDVDDAAIAVVKTAEAQALFTDSRRAAARALEIANRRYKEGYADFQRVLDAQRALFSQEERELLNQSAHLSATVALYRALGGGWQPMAIDEMISNDALEQMRQRVDWDSLPVEALDQSTIERAGAGTR